VYFNIGHAGTLARDAEKLDMHGVWRASQTAVRNDERQRKGPESARVFMEMIAWSLVRPDARRVPTHAKTTDEY
jgi:hypothetical protein